ncbi:unnamed protein product, partial [marine sediment metagenome]
EGESSEATSHALVTEGAGSSHNFKNLGDNIRQFRKKLQNDSVSSDEGILAVRKLRGQFESFNPEYDVSKCKSCGDIEDFLEELDTSKNLNTSRNNSYVDDDNMKSKNTNISGKGIATVYGGQLLGFVADAGINSYVPTQYNTILKGVLAAGLPLASYFVKMPNKLAEVLVLIGGYVTTKLVEQVAEGALTPAIAVRRAVVVTPPVGVAPRAVGVAQTKYVIT